MKKLFGFLLATSITANAWLYVRTPAVMPEPETRAAGARLPTAVSRSTTAVKLSPAIIQPLLALESADLSAVRDALRAAGADEASIRGILEGALRARYAVQAHAGAGRAGAGRGPSVREAVLDPLRELVGVDPLDLADAEARYDFLPADKRRKLALIDLDYTELRSRSLLAQSRGATKAELDEQQLLAAERRKDVLATLSAEERAEYELRFSKTAALNSRRFAGIGVTEQEFRAIQPLIVELREQLPETSRDLHAPARVELEQRTLDRLVAAVGYDRALDYIWGSDSGPHASTARMLREMNLPTSNASRLLQLAAETGTEATAIHYDTSLTPDQKRAALVSLQQTVRPRLDALVPPEAQSKLHQDAIGWFGLLGEGRYARRPPTLFGSGYMMSQPISVTTPPVGSQPVGPLARRSGK